MPSRAHIDEPSGAEIDKPHFHLYGWYTSSDSASSADPVRVFLNRHEVPLSVYRRPDVEATYPKLFSRGFSTFVWLSRYVDNGRLSLAVDVSGRRIAEKTYSVKPEAAQSALAQLRYKESKRKWLLAHLRCPVCQVALAPREGNTIVCARCGTVYPVNDEHINFIPPAFRTAGEVQFQGNICSHAYDRDVMKIVEDVRSRGGMLLDCGAGYRGCVDENIITTEITGYPTTDVLAANQALPFVDNAFDAVLSLHVLEHVSDPFSCSQELVRVTKPGGIIFAATPMIVPEHGYPYHFFNPTVEGLKRLFATTTIERVFIPRMGHPINGVRSVLDLYARSLPAACRRKFLKLTVSELLAGSLEECLDTEIAVQLSDEGRRRLAANFAVQLRKAS